MTKPRIQTIENGLSLFFDDHCYAIKDIQYEQHRLKANIKAFSAKESKEIFHIDIVNLYSSASRSNFIRSCAALFGQILRLSKKKLMYS